jgi:hypothetical protein
MTKEDIIESYATTLKSWVGLALSKEECVSLISAVTNEALSLGTVVQAKPEKFYCVDDSYYKIDRCKSQCLNCNLIEHKL